MKASNLRQLTLKELEVKLNEAKEEAFNLRFQREIGQLEDMARMKAVKHEIARILTVMREMQLEAGNEQ